MLVTVFYLVAKEFISTNFSLVATSRFVDITFTNWVIWLFI